MKNIFLVIGAAALAISTPSLAKGPGKSGSKGHSTSAKHGAKSRVSAQSPASAKSNKSHAKARTRVRTAGLTDTNGDGRINTGDVLDRNLDGLDDRTGKRYGGAACPPGLARRSPACVPPGQAKRQFVEGQRIPKSYKASMDYEAIPDGYRSQVPFSATSQYVYRDNQVFVVDPATRVVTSIINLIR